MEQSSRFSLIQTEFRTFRKCFDSNDLCGSADILRMSFNIALLANEGVVDITCFMGLPVLITSDSRILVLPIIDNLVFKALSPSGDMIDISDEELTGRFVFSSQDENLFPEIYVVSVSTNPNGDENKILYHGNIYSYSTERKSICVA